MDFTKRFHWICVVLILMIAWCSVPVKLYAESIIMHDVVATGGDGRVYLEWNPPSSLVSDYIVEYCTVDDCKQFDDKVSPLSSTVVTGLQNDQPYTFRVSAVQARRVIATMFTTVAVTPRSVFMNGSFESDPASTGVSSLTGWTLVGANTSSPANRINLGVTELGGCPSQDITDYQTAQLRGSDVPEDDDPTPINTFITQTSLVTWMSEATPSHGMNMLMLKNDVVAGPSIPNGYHVVHGPAVVSDMFSATAGQVVTLDWYPLYVRDDYAILGYLLDTATCTQYKIIDASGDRVIGWQYASLVIPATKSTYRFVFVHGTFDKSGGRFSGAELYIDNISIGVPQTVTFPHPPTKNYSDPAFALTATASSGLTVDYRSLTPTVCSVSTNTVTLIAAGECTIQASQPGGVAGSTMYAASAKTERTFTVTGFTPTLTPTNTYTPTSTFTPSTPTPSETPTNTLTITPHPFAFKDVAVGASFTLAVLHNGTLVTWGFNREGQATIPRYMINQSVDQVEVGSNYAVALGSNGRIFVWGANDFKQLLIPNAARSGVKDISANLGHIMALKTNGSLVIWGRNDFKQTQAPSSARTDISAIGAGHSHALAVKNGRVIAWGRNTWSQANVPNNLTNVVAVSGGFDHSLALQSNGTVACWGRNNEGQCRMPNGMRNIVAISAGVGYSLALGRDGEVYSWGRSNFGQAKVPNGISKAGAIAAGYVNSVIGLRDATVLAFGNSTLGALVSRTPTVTP